MLKINALTVLYNGREAVKDVSLTVEENSLTTIFGPNGAGKSSILNTVAGLHRRYRGKIFFRGESLRGLQAFEIARLGISLVPERRQLFPGLTVLDNLKLGAYNNRARQSIQHSLRTVYEIFPVLEEKARQRAENLSGGEQQMLAIGRAVMSAPYLMMLDEPSLGLSPLMTEKIYTAISRLQSDMGLTVLIAEQVIGSGVTGSNKLYVISNGRVVAEGKPTQIMSGQLWRAYLGVGG
ncbi:MAG: ABC transporter ATP-binding protein [Nitrososphaerota archaeon]